MKLPLYTLNSLIPRSQPSLSSRKNQCRLMHFNYICKVIIRNCSALISSSNFEYKEQSFCVCLVYYSNPHRFLWNIFLYFAKFEIRKIYEKREISYFVMWRDWKIYISFFLGKTGEIGEISHFRTWQKMANLAKFHISRTTKICKKNLFRRQKNFREITPFHGIPRPSWLQGLLTFTIHK